MLITLVANFEIRLYLRLFIPIDTFMNVFFIVYFTCSSHYNFSNPNYILCDFTATCVCVCVYSFETGSAKILVYHLRINRYNHIWKQENLFK